KQQPVNRAHYRSDVKDYPGGLHFRLSHDRCIIAHPPVGRPFSMFELKRTSGARALRLSCGSWTHRTRSSKNLKGKASLTLSVSLPAPARSKILHTASVGGTCC